MYLMSNLCFLLKSAVADVYALGPLAWFVPLSYLRCYYCYINTEAHFVCGTGVFLAAIHTLGTLQHDMQEFST